jgi:hypothetical protein
MKQLSNKHKALALLKLLPRVPTSTMKDATNQHYRKFVSKLRTEDGYDIDLVTFKGKRYYAIREKEDIDFLDIFIKVCALLIVAYATALYVYSTFQAG